MAIRDLDIRQALRKAMETIHDQDTLVLDELGLCQGEARVDVAVVNGVLHGYEIKSEHDTLARLASQQEIYNRVLDRVTIVTGSVHAAKAERAVPAWWGIEVAHETDGEVQLTTVRDARDNPSVDLFAQAQLLWRGEALHALEQRDLATGLKSKPRKALWERLASELSAQELGSLVRDRLRFRAGRRADGPPA